MKRLLGWRIKLLVPPLLLFMPLTAIAVEKVGVTSKTPITMTVKKQQSLVVQGTTVQNARSASILSSKNKVVKGFTTRLSCKAPASKGSKGSCDVKLTITGAVPIGQYKLNLLDAKRQVLATGPFNVKADPAVAKKQQVAKQKAAQVAKQKAAQVAKQKATQVAKQKAEQVAKQKAAQVAKQKATQVAKQKAEQVAKQKTAQVAKQKAAQVAKQKAEQVAKKKAVQVVKQNAAAEQKKVLSVKQKSDVARASAVKKQQAEASKGVEQAAKKETASDKKKVLLAKQKATVSQNKARAGQLTTRDIVTASKAKEADPQMRQKVVQLSPDKKPQPVSDMILIDAQNSRTMTGEDRAAVLQPQDGGGFEFIDPLRQITAPDGTPVIVGNPYPVIAISSFTAEGDVASGKRQARISFATENASATYYRAVSVRTADQTAPFLGVDWKPYTSGQPIVELFECGRTSMDDYRIALQVKGPDVPNPSNPSQSIANISPIAYAAFQLPESLQSRISKVYRFPGAGGSDPVQMPGNARGDGGFVRAGQQTAGQVASFLLEIKNHPGGMTANSVRSVNRNCFKVTAVGNVINEPGGTATVQLDGRFNESSSCQPQIVVGQCGVGDERFHARNFPLRFDKITTVYTDTNSIAGKFTTSSGKIEGNGCQGFENYGGDLSFSTESPGPLPIGCGASLKIIFDDAYNESWKLFFKSSASGQCGLGKNYVNNMISGALSLSPMYLALKAALNSRGSDYNWAYDDMSLSPFSVQPADLGSGLNYYAGFYTFTHTCGVNGGSIRTWLDKAEHTRFVSEPVRTLQ